MKKIITAIGNPYFNKKLKERENIDVVEKDIQYREAILEILEKIKKINYIIINEKIPGEISIEDLIKKIKVINKKIIIIFLLNNENKDKEKILKKLGVNEIFIYKKINIYYLINIIEEKDKIKKDKTNKKYKNLEIIQNIKNKIDNKKENKIISISGFHKTGKTTITILFSILLMEKNKKILIINLNKKIENSYLKLIKNKNINKEEKEIKINNNIFLIYNFNNLVKNNEKNIRETLIELNKKYEIILIDIGFNIKENIKKEIFEFCNKNIYLLDGSTSKIRNLIKKENSYYPKNKLILIQNKYCVNSINSKIIKKITNENKYIFKIYLNKKYKKNISNLLKNKKIKLNKIIKYYLYKIIIN